MSRRNKDEKTTIARVIARRRMGNDANREKLTRYLVEGIRWRVV
jgi:hypothetical protein